MAIPPSFGDNQCAKRTSWIRDPDDAASWLNVDDQGNLCVKATFAAIATETLCGGKFILIEFVTPSEIDLTALLTPITNSWFLHNTKPATKYDVRLANAPGNGLNLVEPYLDLGWGCIYEGIGRGPIWVSSDNAGHRLILELVEST